MLLDRRTRKGGGMNNFILEFGQSIFAGFKNAFNFSDTASKREFWFFILFFFIAYVVVWILDEVFLEGAINLRDLPMGDLLPSGYFDPEVGLAVLLFRPVMAIPTISATVRRLHDTGRSGWWAALWVLPLPMVGWFWLIPWLLQPSKNS